MVSNISGGQIQGFNPNAGQVQGQLRQFDPLGGINNRNLQVAGVQGTQGGINQGGLSNIDPQAVQNQLSGNLQGVGLQGSQKRNKSSRIVWYKSTSCAKPIRWQFAGCERTRRTGAIRR